MGDIYLVEGGYSKLRFWEFVWRVPEMVSKCVGAAMVVMGQSAQSSDLNKKISPGKSETLIQF